MGGTDLHAVPPEPAPDVAATMAAYATRDGLTRAGAALVRRAETYHENTARKRQWLKDHPRDAIREVETHLRGTWHEAVRDNRQLVQANDLGMLMNQLEADFDTPESRQPS